METKAEETKEEFLQTQVVVSIELSNPLHYGKREVSHLEITIEHDISVKVINNVLTVYTQQAGVSEHFPMANVVKWRIVSNLVPSLVGYEFGSYEYDPYTYPERLGNYLGSYSNSSGCIAFLSSNMQVEMV
ncbi:hypothetical protein LCGC14_0702700 [marine sediment metagenome]|uniref:Uncharacterized protein n=1 Tax=marine sediment metagenome TaxID=412755 RepID=A0A0F9QM05_9ZZZZ